jgi:phosphonate transport system substrate-binding protein
MRRTLVLLLLTLLVMPQLAEPADSALLLGILPRHNYADTISMFAPIAKHLSATLHREVKVETARTFSEFWRHVEQRRYDIVHMNQMQYLLAHAKQSYEVIAKNEEFGSSSISSQILVRKDSPIQTLRDLHGKKIIFGGDNTAMMSYIIPRSMLRAQGVSDHDYSSDFALNPPNALIAVSLGMADACGVGDSVAKLSESQQKIHLNDLRVIAQSPAFPHLAWAVTNRLSAEQRQAVRRALLELNMTAEGKQILQRAKLSGLAPATHQEYQSLQKYME